MNWAGWGAADKSTVKDRVQPEQQNPLVLYIEQNYDRGYRALSEGQRQKRFGDLYRAGTFRADPGLQELGSDGIKTGEPKAWTNFHEVQQGGVVGKVLGAVGSVLGKLAKPLVGLAATVLPGGGVVKTLGEAVLGGGKGSGVATVGATSGPLSPSSASPAQGTSLSAAASGGPKWTTVALLGAGALVLVLGAWALSNRRA
jgi:hypothetical protein